MARERPNRRRTRQGRTRVASAIHARRAERPPPRASASLRTGSRIAGGAARGVERRPPSTPGGSPKDRPDRRRAPAPRDDPVLQRRRAARNESPFRRSAGAPTATTRTTNPRCPRTDPRRRARGNEVPCRRIALEFRRPCHDGSSEGRRERARRRLAQLGTPPVAIRTDDAPSRSGIAPTATFRSRRAEHDTNDRRFVLRADRRRRLPTVARRLRNPDAIPSRVWGRMPAKR